MTSNWGRYTLFQTRTYSSSEDTTHPFNWGHACNLGGMTYHFNRGHACNFGGHDTPFQLRTCMQLWRTRHTLSTEDTHATLEEWRTVSTEDTHATLEDTTRPFSWGHACNFGGHDTPFQLRTHTQPLRTRHTLSTEDMHSAVEDTTHPSNRGHECKLRGHDTPFQLRTCTQALRTVHTIMPSNSKLIILVTHLYILNTLMPYIRCE